MLSCGNNDWQKLQLGTLEGGSIDAASLSKNQNVFIFLSPECPLCENYSVPIKALMDSLGDDSLHFIGVVSGAYFSNDAIRRYLLRHELALPILLDPDLELARSLGASITPEVFFTDRSGAILYQGAINDWAISLGQKKQAAQHHYLRDAIVAHKEGREISPKLTKAVGCFIE